MRNGMAMKGIFPAVVLFFCLLCISGISSSAEEKISKEQEHMIVLIDTSGSMSSELENELKWVNNICALCCDSDMKLSIIEFKGGDEFAPRFLYEDSKVTSQDIQYINSELNQISCEKYKRTDHLKAMEKVERMTNSNPKDRYTIVMHLDGRRISLRIRLLMK